MLAEIGPKIPLFRASQMAKIGGFQYADRTPELSPDYVFYICDRSCFIHAYDIGEDLFVKHRHMDHLREGHICCAREEPVFFGNISLWEREKEIYIENEDGASSNILVGFLKRVFCYPQTYRESEQILQANPEVKHGGRELGTLMEVITTGYQSNGRALGLCE